MGKWWKVVSYVMFDLGGDGRRNVMKFLFKVFIVFIVGIVLVVLFFFVVV